MQVLRRATVALGGDRVEMTALLVLLAVVLFAEAIAPFTKVEESFNMQAIHDIIFCRDVSRCYDHHRFPGVVPRTFLGALVLAGIAAPAASLVVDGGDALIVSHVARCSLGLAFVASLWYLGSGLNVLAAPILRSTARRQMAGSANHGGKADVPCSAGENSRPKSPRLNKKTPASSSEDKQTKKQQQRDGISATGGGVLRESSEDSEDFERAKTLASLPTLRFPRVSARAWLLLLASGVFHLVFYCTRTLPNTFALVLLSVAAGLLVRREWLRGLCLCAVTSTVFRGDVFALIAPLGLLLVFSGCCSLWRGVSVGALSVVAAIAVTVPVDSYFWGRWLWPEGEVLFFNTVENKSHLWGTQPWHWYVTYALPRCFLGMLPSVLWSWWRARSSLELRVVTYSAIAFIALYSALPHKEVRFVLVVVPWLLAPLAVSLARIGGSAFRDASAARLVEELPKQIAIEGSLLCARRATRRRIQTAMLLTLVATHVVASIVSCVISSENYPGGDGLRVVHRLIVADAQEDRQEQCAKTLSVDRKEIRVSIDAFAAMTGITRFGKLHSKIKSSSSGAAYLPSWDGRGLSVVYNKDPSLFNTSLSDDNATYDDGFDYLLRRSGEDALHKRVGRYERVQSVRQFERLRWTTFTREYAPFLTVWRRRPRGR